MTTNPSRGQTRSQAGTNMIKSFAKFSVNLGKFLDGFAQPLVNYLAASQILTESIDRTRHRIFICRESISGKICALVSLGDPENLILNLQSF